MKLYLMVILLISILLVSCSPKTVQEGDTVTIKYTSTLADGTSFESSEEYDIPITFVVGEQQVLEGLEKATIGMKEGEQKTVLLRPEEAYGFPDPSKIQKMPLDTFPSGTHMRIGKVFPFTNEQNQEVFGKVMEIKPDGIVMDFNHLLVGESLWFNVTLVKIGEKN